MRINYCINLIKRFWDIYTTIRHIQITVGGSFVVLFILLLSIY